MQKQIKAGGYIGKRVIIELENLDEQAYLRIEEVLAALTAVSVPSKRRLFFGELTIDPLERIVLRNGEEIPLTAKEFDILYLLASYPGIVFTHRQI